MKAILVLFIAVTCLFIGLHEPFGFWDAVGYGLIILTFIHKLKQA